MKHKRRSVALVLAVLALLSNAASYADNCCPPKTGDIKGKTVVAGLLSLIIWPGIGQAVNSNPGEKVATHAVLGLLPPYRIWSGYDALVDRHGGYWQGRI